MHNVGVVSKNSLQGVLAGRKLDGNLALTHIQMNVVLALAD